MRAQEFVLELRRNPQQNPRVSGQDVLKPLAQDHSVFVSYTKIPKLGINPDPRSINTPAGVYAYPLYLIWPDIQTDLTNVPFPANPRYMYVFRSPTPVMDVREFGRSDLRAAMRRLHGVARWLKPTPNSWDEPGEPGYLSSFAMLLDYTRKMALKQQDVTDLDLVGGSHGQPARKSPRSYVFTWNQLLKKATGHDAFVDPGHGIIHGGEPTQAMFLNPSQLQIIERIDL